MRNDYDIQEDILTELKWQPFLVAANIGVSVKNGIATLSGSVDNYAQKLAAERAAKKVTGVRAIAEDIQIGVSPYDRKTDTEIAVSVVNAIRWHSAVPEDRVKAKVENGIVTLEGEVDWEYQRKSAKDAVSQLAGVINVVNRISVRPAALATDVTAKITAAFHRSAMIDAENVRVEVKDGTVTLKGIVRSTAEKDDAEEAAWCAPGVDHVINKLFVEPQLELIF
jgi:osmotically-inducible protein OsmY